jgi:hypothetical protein
MLLAAALLVSPLMPQAWHQIGPNPRPMEFGTLPTPGRRKTCRVATRLRPKSTIAWPIASPWGAAIPNWQQASRATGWRK